MKVILGFIAAALVSAGIAFTPTPAAATPQIQPQVQYGLNSDVQVVSSWYQRYLGREPDAIGLQGWVRQLQVGYNVEAGILGSDEYYIRHGSTPESFIVGLYVEVLNRQPRLDEVQSWLNRLQTVGYNREALAADFLNAAALERGGAVAPTTTYYEPRYSYYQPATSYYQPSSPAVTGTFILPTLRDRHRDDVPIREWRENRQRR